METIKLTRIGKGMSGHVYRDEKGRHYTDMCHNLDGTPDFFALSPWDDPDGEPAYRIDRQVEITNPPTERDIREDNLKFEYMMLGRYADDCAAYFGKHGDPEEDKWDCRYHNDVTIPDIAGDVKETRRRYEQFPDDLKPEWLTIEQIEKWEKLLEERINNKQ